MEPATIMAICSGEVCLLGSATRVSEPLMPSTMAFTACLTVSMLPLCGPSVDRRRSSEARLAMTWSIRDHRMIHGLPVPSRRMACRERNRSCVASISSLKPDTLSTFRPRGTPQPEVSARMRRRWSHSISQDRSTGGLGFFGFLAPSGSGGAAAAASAAANILSSASGGTCMPSHLMNSRVLRRPHGVKVRMSFLGIIFSSRHRLA
mmetsp:Transcript_29895/g.76691  ORF Transcript_29895/g.76691 Transcript_29895/m.76691 type:complete len:206 (-) Transcript_29895:327-944(-)